MLGIRLVKYCPDISNLYVSLNGEIKELLTIEKEINQYALKEGFTTLEIIGRAGWEKVLHGYERVAVMLRKDVHHGIH